MQGVPKTVPPRAGNPVMAACIAGGGVTDAGVWLLVISGVLRDGCRERSPGMRGGPGPAPPVRRGRPGAGCTAGPSGSRPTCSPPATGHKGGTPHLSPTVFPHRRRRWATRRGPRGGPSEEHSRSTHSTAFPPAVDDIVGSKPRAVAELGIMDNGLSLSPLIVNLIPARLDTCVEPSHQATSLGFIGGRMGARRGDHRLGGLREGLTGQRRPADAGTGHLGPGTRGAHLRWDRRGAGFIGGAVPDLRAGGTDSEVAVIGIGLARTVAGAGVLLDDEVRRDILFGVALIGTGVPIIAVGLPFCAPAPRSQVSRSSASRPRASSSGTGVLYTRHEKWWRGQWQAWTAVPPPGKQERDEPKVGGLGSPSFRRPTTDGFRRGSRAPAPGSACGPRLGLRQDRPAVGVVVRPSHRAVAGPVGWPQDDRLAGCGGRSVCVSPRHGPGPTMADSPGRLFGYDAGSGMSTSTGY